MLNCKQAICINWLIYTCIDQIYAVILHIMFHTTDQLQNISVYHTIQVHATDVCAELYACLSILRPVGRIVSRLWRMCGYTIIVVI